jgi:hypothetical protein
LSHLLALKKFRKKGNKDGAVRAFFRLEDEGLGKVLELGSGGVCVVSHRFYLYSCLLDGELQQYEFDKVPVPEDKDERVALSKKLQKYNISLTQYIHVLRQKDLKPT